MKKMYTIIAALLMSNAALSQNNDVVSCTIICPEGLIENALPGANSKNVDYTLNFECESQPVCEITYNNLTIDVQSSNNHAVNTNWAGLSWIVANDFDIPAGETIEISKFIPTLLNYASNADIYFFENNNGVPGELIISFLGIEMDDINTLGNTPLGNPVYEATYILPNTVELTSGKYWVGIHTEYLNPPNPYVSVYWANSESIATNGHHAFKSSDGGTSWNTSGSMQLADGVFKLVYECEGVELIRTVGPASGESFPLGETNVTHELKYGNTVLDTCTFSVTVNETPILCNIECPENIDTQATDNASSTIVTYEIQTVCETEGITTELMLLEGLASGSEFPVGETIVTYHLLYNEEILDTCSFTVNVEENLSTHDTAVNDLILHPNPVFDVLNINSFQIISSIQIYTISGSLIKTIEINATAKEIDLSNLASGIYFIKNNTGNNSEILKIIKR